MFCHRLILLVTVLSLGACARARAVQPCQAGDDVCAFERLQGSRPATAKSAAAEIAKLDDPVVRSAAVGAWLASAPNTAPADAEALCALLTESEHRNCTRRANSPHLHR